MKAIVIGAGPAGLATAACLKRAGINATILERSDRVASSWRGHYDSLHLHTARGRSGLPKMPLPKAVGRYPTRADVIAYLDRYAKANDLDIRFECKVKNVRRSGDSWQVSHTLGQETSEIVVFATGLNATPRVPDWPGKEGFAGEILHSSAYRNPDVFKGRRVLVVGFGNSGGDIARDLAQAGVAVGLCVRGPINILPKEILGFPTTSLGLLGKIFPTHVADALTAPVVRAIIGRPQDYGLRQADKGPLRQVVEDGKVPLIDVGALPEIKAGRITVHPGIERFDGVQVVFEDMTSAAFDAVILATGYDMDVRPMLPEAEGVLDEMGRPLVSGGRTAEAGLYFCSYHVSPNGQLKQASDEAIAIAKDATRLKHPA